MVALGGKAVKSKFGNLLVQFSIIRFKQFEARDGTEAGRHVLIGMARFLAAHSPTPRAVSQTYDTAVRLQRGEEIYREI